MTLRDAAVQDVKMARAKEHHERTGVIGLLVNAGHITVLQDEDPAFIRLQIEDEIFKEERGRFPTTTLIARLQLAIASGRSERNVEKIEDYAMGDAMQYAMQAGSRAHRAVGKHAALAMAYGGEMGGMRDAHISQMLQRKQDACTSDALETGYHNVAKITATVTSPKFRKGLRP